MAQLVLGAAGAGVGFMLGGPTGAQIGWMIGSSLGAMVGPGQHSEGPRLGDKTISSSTLGTPMTRLYGTARLAGNVIACTNPIREVPHTHSYGMGGVIGGLFGSKVTQTTYTYNTDIAIDLCAGPAAGIRKIWSDGKLVYDVSAGSTAQTIIASAVNAASFTFYSGDESQLPDPTLEAMFGVGSTPAYRGRCYVVLSQLDCPSGRIPQLTFEVAMSATIGAANELYCSAPNAGTFQNLASIGEKDTFQFEASETSILPAHSFYQIGNGYSNFVCDQNISQPDQTTDWGIMPVQSPDKPRGVNRYYLPPNPGMVEREAFTEWGIADQFNTFIVAIDCPTNDDIVGMQWGAYDSVSAQYAIVGPSSTMSGNHATIMPSLVKTSPSLTLPGSPVAFYNNVVYNVGSRSGTIYLDQYSGDDGTLQTSIAYSLPATINTDSLLICANSHGVFVLEGYAAPFGTNRQIWRVTASGWELLSGVCNFENSDNTTRTFFCNGNYAIVGPSAMSGGHVTYRVLGLTAVAPNLANVADIIKGECVAAGLQLSQIDVSGITDTVIGYPVTRASSARDNLLPILMAFFIDPVEVDGVLRFTKRVNAPQAGTVVFDDLASTAQAGTPTDDPFPLARTQDADLPRSITVQYANTATDYQQGAEVAIRQVTSAVNEEIQDIAICTTSDHAKQIADVLLFDAWNTRNARSGKLTRKWAKLTPGDVVSVEYPRGTFQSRQLTRVQDSGALIEFEAIDANAELYQTTPPGSTGGTGQTVDTVPPPPSMVLLDGPLLRDQDDYFGAYVGIASPATGFHGADLYVGLGTAEAAYEGTVTAPAPQGRCQTALGDWTMGTIDETNTVTVATGPDALSNATRAAVVQGTSNVCAIGAPGRWEILQFIRATSAGTGLYVLSGLKRGMLGTEQYRGTHTASDEFVLLKADGSGVLKPHFQLSDLGATKKYIPVPQGKTTDDGFSQSGVDNGACLKPLSPIKVRKVVATDGTISYTWGRRTRKSQNWLAGTMPLGESSESYDVELRGVDGSLIGTASGLTSPTWAQVFTLQHSAKYSYPVWGFRRYGSSYFGIGRPMFSAGPFSVFQLDVASNNIIATSYSLGGYTRALITDGNSILYAASSDATDPPGSRYTSGAVYRFNAAAFTKDGTGKVPPTHTYTASQPGDPYGLAFDGANVWCAEYITGQIVRLAGATLAKLNAYAVTGGPQAMAYAGGFLYICCWDSSELVKFDVSTNSIVWRVATVHAPSDIIVQNGLVFVTSQTGDGVQVHNTTGAVVNTIATAAVTAYFALLGQGQLLSTFQGDVIALLVPTDGSHLLLLTIDGTTGLEKKREAVEASAISGSDGDLLFMIYTPTGLAGQFRTDVFQRMASTVGATFTVWQNSASVGRGYPASITI